MAQANSTCAGLSQAEARQRLQAVGANEVQEAAQTPWSKRSLSGVLPR
ncbi:cation-transporting P-type ATPase [Candidatus Igneacidithiobacillus taiwanensis]